MEFYDITQELFSCEVYPGDTPPMRTDARLLARGDSCNLTDFSMGAHNGTHVDAPLHFVDGSESVSDLPLTRFVGRAMVVSHQGDVTAFDAEKMLKLLKDGTTRILIRGDATMTEEAANVFAKSKIDLIGNESQTFGPVSSPAPVHRILLGAGMVLLEGIRLSHVPDGEYLLSCAPINLTGGDGSPCRAFLMK